MIRHAFARHIFSHDDGLSIKLTAGSKASVTLITPLGERPLHGGLNWTGKLSETGQCGIQVGTDEAARYMLEISFKMIFQ